MEPIDEDIQMALGSAVEAFPQLLPRVFNTYRNIGKRMHARNAAARQQIEEEIQQEELQTGNNIPEFTQILMTSLEENTSKEPWDSELRRTLTDQMIEFLQQNTSVDPEYLVQAYEQHLQQLITAQNNRLREKHCGDSIGMLKESGVIKRIITKIPDIARETFKNYGYNPDKKVRLDPVYAEAEYEEDVWEEEVQQTSTPKRPGSTIPPPEAKMAARPESMTSYRNPKQEVVPFEAQMQSRSGGIGDELEDEQFKLALAQSAREMYYDPTETPNTGGSAASSSPSGQAGVQPQQQPGTPTLRTKEELAIAQENFRRISDELVELQVKMRTVNCSEEDLERLEYLQPIAIAYRKQIGIFQQSQALLPEGTTEQPKGVTTKRRTDDQGTREKGVKHRTIGASHQGSEGEDKPVKASYSNIGDIFNKGAEDLSSSVPSSAAKTPTSIPTTFQESALILPTEQEATQSSEGPAQSQVSLPTDPRTALASSIRHKLKKTGQLTPTPKRGGGTAGSTPSSFDDMD